MKSSYLNFPEQILITVKTHFLPEHISFAVFEFLIKDLWAELKRLSCHGLLVVVSVTL